MDTKKESALLGAVLFAAQKHRLQKRKDDETPYINHPVAVAELLARVGDPVAAGYIGN